jgi:DNA-binding transcriptional ArsR family regulator
VGLFKALADPTRIRILTSLASGRRTQTVSEVAGACPVDVSVVSRHLKILERAGVLASEKLHRQVLYRVRIPELVGLLRGLADGLEACCPAEQPTISDDHGGAP